MIQTAASTNDLIAHLCADFIKDKDPLITSAGFADSSPYAGQPRQTFSLVLSAATIQAIRDQVQGLYDEIIRDCWPKGEVLPFDMIRFDAFLEPTTNDIKILEINTRNVGLHEVVEWLDETVADEIGVTKNGSINQRFVQNQKVLHASLFGEDEPLLYMSPAFLPRWIYLAELEKAYSKVAHITAAEQGEYTDNGVVVDGVCYRAITKKMAWPATETLKELDAKSEVRILQPRWMRQFGFKDYLQRLASPTVLRTETYSDEHLPSYLASKDQLVLKIIDGGNSKAVFLGGLLTDDDWRQKLEAASERPEKWIIQDYCAPPRLNIMAHGVGARELPSQLGIFLLPCPDDPTKFDMDLTVKSYAGTDQHFTFDPSGLNPDIWFGHVIKSTAAIL
ncbi:MAG: hypothetical protein QFB87_01920 [Patescibacteria group bacterium]|nr:hypothetical protein [Patescibacteria group bacterium]